VYVRMNSERVRVRAHGSSPLLLLRTSGPRRSRPSTMLTLRRMRALYPKLFAASGMPNVRDLD
jgi:hypothetical protein